jgi:CHAT domain-containing protein/Flp pilus assembly protein TadD
MRYFFKMVTGFPIFLALLLNAQPAHQNTEDLRSRFASGLKLLGDEQYDAAINQLQRLIEEHPDFQPSYRKLVETYIYLEDLDEAHSYFRNLQKRYPQNPYVYYALSRIYFKNKNYELAIKNLKECLSLDPKYPEVYGPFGGLPEVYKATNQLNMAEELFITLTKEQAENPYPYYGLARVNMKQYRWDSAINMLNKSIEIDSTIQYPYHSFSFIYNIKGQYKKSLRSNLKLKEVAIYNNDLEMVSYSLQKIGGIYFLIGNYHKALSFFIEGLKIASEIGTKRREGIALVNIGAVYATIGKLQKALEYFKLSLDILNKVGPLRTEIVSLYNVGLIYKDLKNYYDAKNYFDMALKLSVNRNYKIEQSRVLMGIAEIYFDQNNYQKALLNYKAALAISRQVSDRNRQGIILCYLGNLQYKIGNYDDANSCFSEALEIARKTKYVFIKWNAHSGLGAILKERGNFKKAIYHFKMAISIFDSVRQNLDLESLTSGFLEDRYEVYPSIIQLLAEQGKTEQAFRFAEKYKAKTLLEVLSKGQFLLSELLPDSIRFKLLEIRKQIEETHSAIADEIIKNRYDTKKVLEFDQKVTNLQIQKAEVINLIKNNFSDYYQLTSKDPLEINEIQIRLLKPGQLLLEFVVGTKQTSIFAINSDTLLYFDVPISREELKKALADMSSVFRYILKSEQQEITEIFNPYMADFSIPPSYKLYKTLFGKLESLALESSGLIIVPDDFLYYLPFETLVTDTLGIRNRYDFSSAQFMIEKVNISYSSSASLFDKELQLDRNPSQGILAFGNPNFSYLNSSGKEPSTFSNDQQILDFSRETNHFPQLPNAEEEVKNIANLFGSSETQVFIGDKCSESIFKKLAKEFRIIHLATHFMVDDHDPLYSKIVLSEPNDENEDGFLQTFEIFDLQLNADLVVLSACNTALGKLSKGEGIIGASRAFLYAGVPSMVVSLWNVDDQATSMIMNNFYEYLGDGLNKSEALRLSKLKYLKNVDFQRKDPFYWAPFILLGDVSPIPLRPGSNFFWKLIMYVGIIIAFIFLLVFLNQKKGKETKSFFAKRIKST